MFIFAVPNRIFLLCEFSISFYTNFKNQMFSKKIHLIFQQRMSHSKRRLQAELEQKDITGLWEFKESERTVEDLRLADEVYGRKYGNGLMRVNIQSNPYTHKVSISFDLFGDDEKLIRLQERIYLHALKFLKHFGRSMTKIEIDYDAKGYNRFRPKWQQIESTIKTMCSKSLVYLTLANNEGGAFRTVKGSVRSFPNLKSLTI